MFPGPAYICCWELSLLASLSLNGSSCEIESWLAILPVIPELDPDPLSPEGDIPDELDVSPDTFFFDIRSLPMDESLLVETDPLVDTESLETSFSGIF